jgi:transcriptional regulator with XRE-family HTH domain
MSKLKILREQKNITQEELSERSGVSVRTIQRIEAGSDPKCYTLRILSQTLGIQELELIGQRHSVDDNEGITNSSKLLDDNLIAKNNIYKLINFSAIPFIVLPPLNILVPFFLTKHNKASDSITKQIVTLQLLWTIGSVIVFMLWVLMKLANSLNIWVLTLLVLVNLIITIRNAIEIDKNNNLYYKLKFSLI